ncbi:hypothetical protein R1sor_018925 [Riccia sorocarpa]|uniref:GPI transamidase subunit PIG-U n=1 Tax=Riccia sorocarpa TaxID=122646 RepID=A0ABD3IB53_9MARC
MTKPIVWRGAALAIAVRFAFAAMGVQEHLGRRVEIVTPLTSLMRLAEGQWFKQHGLSPYAGSAYHGSPLLLSLLGPLTSRGTGGQLLAKFHSSFFVFLVADLLGAFLLQKMGKLVESAHQFYQAELQLDPETSKSAVKEPRGKIRLGIRKGCKGKEVHAKVGLGDLAALSYLLNPFTIAVCVGGTTSPVENLLVIVALYGALKGNAPLAAFGWAMSTHLSLYPAILLLPISFLMVSGSDRPQLKVLERACLRNASDVASTDRRSEVDELRSKAFLPLQWRRYGHFWFFSVLWWLAIIFLSAAALGGHENLVEMISETYGFILRVDDLSPNLGLFWYFFTEVFTHFREFFVMVFHANILFVLVPLTIRFHHRPLFLAYTMVAVATMLKSYPSDGDAALSLGLLALCTPVLSDFRFSFLVLNGYLVVAILSPSMYNLWIWRGTGNANFYFAMTLVYACVQSILIVESVGAVIRHDRSLWKSFEVRVKEESVVKAHDD